MNRDVSWQRIMVAVLIGFAVFAGGKFAYGFQISKDDIIGIAISLAVVFGKESGRLASGHNTYPPARPVENSIFTHNAHVCVM